MLWEGEIGKQERNIAKTGAKDTPFVLRGDLPDATLCPLLFKLSAGPSNRFFNW
jgi:hypothetical protein